MLTHCLRSHAHHFQWRCKSGLKGDVHAAKVLSPEISGYHLLESGGRPVFIVEVGTVCCDCRKTQKNRTKEEQPASEGDNDAKRMRLDGAAAADNIPPAGRAAGAIVLQCIPQHVAQEARAALDSEATIVAAERARIANPTPRVVHSSIRPHLADDDATSIAMLFKGAQAVLEGTDAGGEKKRLSALRALQAVAGQIGGKRHELWLRMVRRISPHTSSMRANLRICGCHPRMRPNRQSMLCPQTMARS
jgi:hypothetical protein